MAGKAKKVVEAPVEAPVEAEAAAAATGNEAGTLYEYQVVAGKHEDRDDDGTFYFVRAGETLLITKETAAKFPGKFKLVQRQAISGEATEVTETEVAASDNT